MFFEDAIIASRELEITLTGRDCGLEERAPMCGVPYHAAENYIAKLIEKGYKVAICEQTQDPEETKGLVERKVVRIVTPGTVIESSILDEKSNNYLLSIFAKGYGLACIMFQRRFLYNGNHWGNTKGNEQLARIPAKLVNEALQDSDFRSNTSSIFFLYNSMA